MPVTYIFIYLKSSCHDEQSGGQVFVLHSRIAKLWQFKGRKVESNHEKDHIAFLKAGLWQSG